MWLFTRHGFYSVVQSKDTPTHMMIRSRHKDHLANLLAFCDLDGHIVESAQTDYRYRLIVPFEQWCAIAGYLAQDIDYSNFKAQAEKEKKWVGKAYVEALHDVWQVMWDATYQKAMRKTFFKR